MHSVDRGSKGAWVRAAGYLRCALLLVCIVPLPAYSQPAETQPGRELLRDDQQKREAPPATAPPKIDVTPESRRAVKPPPGVKVDVKSFRFSGLTVVPQGRLQPLVAKFLGPDKTFDDLQAAADAVSEYLQQQGYVVAQAYLPEQSLEGGVVEIAILEGRLAELRIDIDPAVRISRHIVEGL